MLASFESFLETTKLKRDDIEDANFDDAEQTDDVLEREGVDVADVNRLAKSYRSKFGTEMQHPKMDAIVDALSSAWLRGEKILIFVRRVASVKELKRKLDERYDAWLMARLERELPLGVQGHLRAVFKQYRTEQLEAELKGGKRDSVQAVNDTADEQDSGGKDSFFAWFFRGEGPRGVISGANIQQRFIQRGAAYATFFDDNYLADVLACAPGEVETRLAQALRVDSIRLNALLREQSKRFLSRARRHARADRFEAVQAAAIELLKDQSGPYQEPARIIWHERFESPPRLSHATEVPEIGNLLALPTFFTELRKRESLRARLWPRSKDTDLLKAFRERELRAQMLASAARLGHPLIDLYIMTIRRLGSIELRAQESGDDESVDRETARINEYLDLLERQMQTPRADREWGAFDELADIAANFDLILDVNEPDARTKAPQEVARLFGQLLRQQQPVGGMSGQINQTLVRQFRMPGYPLVLVTTDLLQEGEDLHTFCSSVHHYGISWTPSSMEQRIGRIDRVRSQTELRLAALRGRAIQGEDMLQVYFPHLEDTVEVLQVRRVLERMNVFLRLMHEGLITSGAEERSIDANKEFARGHGVVPQISGRLESAFPVRPEHLGREPLILAVDSDATPKLRKRFACLAQLGLPNIEIIWEPQLEPGVLLGTARFRTRVQPFSLLLRSVEARTLVRCVSPVGRIRPGDEQDAVVASTSASPIRIGAIVTNEERTYDLTVEGDVLLADSEETDAARVSMLVNRVVEHADALEQEYLPGRDEILATFRAELLKEDDDGR